MKRACAAAVALLALGGCIEAQAQSAAEPIVIYGRLNVSVESARLGHATSDDAGIEWRVVNNRSVMGWRGSETIEPGLDVLWQFEGTLSPDTGAGSIAARDTRVGIRGALGTLFAGQWPTPYLSSTASFDPLYPTTAGYMSIMGNGSGPQVDHLNNTNSFDRRQRNVLAWSSPNVANLYANLSYGVNDGQVGVDGARPWLASASLTWERDRLTITGAHEIHHEYQGAGTTDRAFKFGAAVRVAAWRLAGDVERLDYEALDGHLRLTAWYLSATGKVLPATTLILAFTHAGNGSGDASAPIGFFRSGARTGARQLTLGVDYALSARSSLYAYASRIDNAAEGRYDFAINPLDARAGEKPRVFSLGVKTAF